MEFKLQSKFFHIKPRTLHKSDMFSSDPSEHPTKEPRLPPAIPIDCTTRFLKFRPLEIPKRPSLHPKNKYYFTFLGSDVKLVRWTLEDNGFRHSKSNWTFLWSTKPISNSIYFSLQPKQKLNHFPRSNEITRKDKLVKNYRRMQAIHGVRNFNFLPPTFLLPKEANELNEAMEGSLWIAKPSGSSQGKGIYLANKIEDIKMTGSVVSKYIEDPLLINGLKFDMRVYVALTSVNPLRIYIYREGLVRFATEVYDNEDFSNTFSHLTNYSLNKESPAFANYADGKGYKWTFEALKEFLESCNIEFSLIWSEMKDIIIKTILSIESEMFVGLEMFVPKRNSCFELFGFDMLIDQTLQVWLLEVNLSPSLNIDSEIDLKVKSQLLADLFTLVGVSNKLYKSKRKLLARPDWDSTIGVSEEIRNEDIVSIKETSSELKRSGNFECIFPTISSFQYKEFFEPNRRLDSILMSHFSQSLRKDFFLIYSKPYKKGKKKTK